MLRFLLQPKVIVLLLLIGGVYYVRNHYDYEDLLKVAAKDEGNPRSQQIEYYVGMIYYARNDYPRAIKAFDQLLTNHPTSYYAPKALARAGLAYKEQQKYEHAREMYFKFLTYFPDHSMRNTVQKRWNHIKFQRGEEVHGHLDEAYEEIPEKGKPD
jgi:tetratricopeptide (TPR) repeat protein